MRGAIQIGYNRTHFDPFIYMREEQGEEAPQMNSSCYFMLCKIIGMTTGYRTFTLLRSISAGTTEDVLTIDPISIVMLLGLNHSTKALLALMVDLDIRCKRSLSIN